MANPVTKLVYELEHLEKEQLEILVKTFLKAKKHNLEYTMTAIAWQESKFGKYMVNLSDPSFGVFHNLITSVQKRHRSNEWNRDRLVEKLLFDYDFSFAESLNELRFWNNVYNNQSSKWSKMVASYNAGYNHKNGTAYLYCIKSKIRALRVYFDKHNFKYK
jgi:hypothetical protein